MHSPNHWSNKCMKLVYINHIIVPYLQKTREYIGQDKIRQQSRLEEDSSIESKRRQDKFLVFQLSTREPSFISQHFHNWQFWKTSYGVSHTAPWRPKCPCVYSSTKNNWFVTADGHLCQQAGQGLHQGSFWLVVFTRSYEATGRKRIGDLRGYKCTVHWSLYACDGRSFSYRWLVDVGELISDNPQLIISWFLCSGITGAFDRNLDDVHEEENDSGNESSQDDLNSDEEH